MSIGESFSLELVRIYTYIHLFHRITQIKKVKIIDQNVHRLQMEVIKCDDRI